MPANIKVTKAHMKEFAEELVNYSLETAMHNLLWLYQRDPAYYHGTKAKQRQARKQKARKVGRNGARPRAGRAQEPVRLASKGAGA